MDQSNFSEETTVNNSPIYDERPWGNFTVLDEGEGYKVKRIEVLPGKRLSYQKHARRAEHWFITQGGAKVTLDDREIILKAGEYIFFLLGSGHHRDLPSFHTRSSADHRPGHQLA